MHRMLEISIASRVKALGVDSASDREMVSYFRKGFVCCYSPFGAICTLKFCFSTHTAYFSGWRTTYRYLLGEYLLAYLGRSVTKLKSFDAGGAESHFLNLLDIWQRYLLECLGEVKPSSPDLLDQW